MADRTPEQERPSFFACCEACGKAIYGTSEDAIRAAIWLHKLDGCDD